jgi:hypothetical protein
MKVPSFLPPSPAPPAVPGLLEPPRLARRPLAAQLDTAATTTVHRTPRRSVLVLLLLLASCLGVAPRVSHAADSPAPESDPYLHEYALGRLIPSRAEQLVWSQCEAVGSACRILRARIEDGRAWLAVEAGASAHRRIARVLAEAEGERRTHRFQVVLVVGTRAGAGTAADRGAVDPAASGPAMPENVARALADVRALLPFDGYQLVDVGWMASSRESTLRLRGPLAQEATVRMVFEDRFDGELYFEKFQVSLNTPAGLEREAGPPRQALDTAFSLRAGETLVVGTSRLDGSDQALIVLITALAPQG